MKSFKSVFICAFVVLGSCTLFQKPTSVQIRFADDCSPQQQVKARQVIIDRIGAVYKVGNFTDIEDGSFSVTYFPQKDVEVLPGLLEERGEIIICESYFASEITDLLSDVIEEESMLFYFLASVHHYPNNMDIGMAQEKDRMLIDSLFRCEEIKTRLPQDASFVWMKKDMASEEAYYSLMAVKKKNLMPLNQETVKSTSLDESHFGAIIMELYPDFHQKWAAMTKRNIGRCLSIVCNEQVLSAPMVMDEITAGKLAISGNFTTEERYIMMGLIKGGTLNCSAYVDSLDN